MMQHSVSENAIEDKIETRNTVLHYFDFDTLKGSDGNHTSRDTMEQESISYRYDWENTFQR